ncbi:MAG: dienelactone hydrolase family protein [Acidobacteriota bacterium]
MSISRRQFVEGLALGGVLGGAGAATSPKTVSAMQAVDASAPHIGNLYEFVQKQADRSPLELSFLHPRFKSLKRWQPRARAKVFEHLFYAPPKAAPQAQLVRRSDRGDYVEEYLTFQTTPDLRIPVCVLVPKNAKFPAPGILALHSHDGIYLWGKEKLVENDGEHPHLTAFKQTRYGGKSIAAELARQGYVVAVTDMFYWGERRMLLADDPPAYRERPLSMTEQEIGAFNRRASQNESLLGRSLLTAGVTWGGVILWDDIRALDYLAARPEVDPKRLGCVGLSVGGYRSFLLAALDERIRVAVDVGWMTSLGSQIKQHVINSVGLSFHIIGLYRYLDLPDLAALIAPRAVLVINGSQDRLFAPEGVKAAFEKVARCYTKAGAPESQQCSLYDAPHEFNLAMQAEAWQWIKRWL